MFRISFKNRRQPIRVRSDGKVLRFGGKGAEQGKQVMEFLMEREGKPLEPIVDSTFRPRNALQQKDESVEKEIVSWKIVTENK